MALKKGEMWKSWKEQGGGKKVTVGAKHFALIGAQDRAAVCHEDNRQLLLLILTTFNECDISVVPANCVLGRKARKAGAIHKKEWVEL